MSDTGLFEPIEVQFAFGYESNGYTWPVKVSVVYLPIYNGKEDIEMAKYYYFCIEYQAMANFVQQRYARQDKTEIETRLNINLSILKAVTNPIQRICSADKDLVKASEKLFRFLDELTKAPRLFIPLKHSFGVILLEDKSEPQIEDDEDIKTLLMEDEEESKENESKKSKQSKKKSKSKKKRFRR